ncbi:MAG: hypothetical protein P1U89_10915 [Verrucomicrobiales bacterium]|nr:hypothetical protein [Verrucomicrobiales bacterium]
MNQKRSTIITGSVLSAVAIGAAFLLLKGCDKIPDIPGVNQVEVVTEPLDFESPAHFLSTNVEASYPLSKAIPKASVITKLDGGSISVQAHPDHPKAQLRMIRLPKEMHATQEAARVLAESQAIQDGDIMVVFRPEWAKFDAYCNIQLGITHTAFATIESEGGKKYVKTVENPLSYSTRLDHATHYGGHDLFHIIRPNLTTKQIANVKAWALKTLEAGDSQVSFFTDYGMPYFARPQGAGATGNLPVDLARAVVYPEKGFKVATYCSEMVWTFLALRDFSPSDLLAEFPKGSDKDPTEWLKGKVNPIVEPLPGVSPTPLQNPGLMQGPDIQMRNVFGADDATRRAYLLSDVLLTKVPNPAETEGHLSTGHARAGAIFRKGKLPQLRAFYQSKNEDPSYIPTLNTYINPNYAPTSFFALTAVPEASRQFTYVGTVTFRPAPAQATTVTEAGTGN